MSTPKQPPEFVNWIIVKNFRGQEIFLTFLQRIPDNLDLDKCREVAHFVTSRISAVGILKSLAKSLNVELVFHDTRYTNSVEEEVVEEAVDEEEQAQ